MVLVRVLLSDGLTDGFYCSLIFISTSDSELANRHGIFANLIVCVCCVLLLLR